MKQDQNLFLHYKIDIRKTWSVMREIIKKNHDKSGISDTFINGNIETSDPTDIANVLCNYFTQTIA